MNARADYSMYNQKPATDKQRTFVEKLLAERYTAGTYYEGWTPDWTKPEATSKATSAVITYLLTLPRKSESTSGADSTPTEEPEAGIYWTNGDHLVRVYKGQHNGRMLAKRVHFEQDGDEKTVSYEYLGLATKVLVPSATPERLSLEDVGSLGRTFDHCLICGRRLDDPESVDRGIGPVCASRY